MPVDFRDSAGRHKKDADLLHANSRWANADHLFGLSAECALKSVMQGLGMTLDPKGIPSAPYNVHVNKLWAGFQSFANSRSGAAYSAVLAGATNPFSNWDISQRYEQGSQVTQAVAEAHRNGADLAMQILNAAILDGVVQ
jgi:hypothetical protein